MKLHRELHYGKVGMGGLPYPCLLLLFVLLSVFPATPAAADSSSGQADRIVYDSLQAGQRPPAERGYEVPSKPTVFLTFDDGPSIHTSDVLNILQSEQVAATFFVLGEHVEKHPELVKRIVREGHAIGNHTYDHVYNKLYGSFGEFWKQIMLTETALETEADVRTRLIRAPGGTHTNFDAAYFYYLEQAGYVINDWNVDSGDSKRAGVPASEIVRGATDLTTTRKTPNQIVVLMHDSSGHGETVKALPDIIRFYKDKGYAFAPLAPEIKPIQSPLGKLKWKRSADFSEYAGWTALAKQHAARWDPDSAGESNGQGDTQPGNPLLLASAGAAPQPAKPSPPLRLQFEAATLTLAQSDYSFREGRLYVPLRELVETMGGSVEWKESSRQAVVGYGLQQITYDLPNRSISVSSPGNPDKRLVMADISLIDHRLMVPLRQAVELLGGEIGGYALDGDPLEVQIAGGSEYAVNLANFKIAGT
ncbi:polysaccharide deacetylase [Paenibacillus hemerocallicola]|nr:polysaccharide deacetylase [Paenibacillus hemerocallicola]